MCGNKETYRTFLKLLVCETAEKQISEVVCSQSPAPDCVHYKSDVVLQLLCCVRYTYNRTEVEVLNSAKLCSISSVISSRVGLMIGLMAVVSQEIEVLSLCTEKLWLAICFKITTAYTRVFLPRIYLFKYDTYGL